MTTPAEFAKNFSGHAVPPELAKLLAFQEENDGFECYSEGFGLLHDDKGGLRSWSDKPAFLDALMPFAQANGSGSFYALWNDGKTKSLSEMPVIAFGDEGGVHVAAENVRALLQLITFDVEPMIDHDEITFYKGDDHEPREQAASYVAWLKKELDLGKTDKPEAIVAAAQKKHKAAFAKWFSQFVSE